MGNNNVYGEGHFITPNKVLKVQSKIEEGSLNMENVFGAVEIPSARAVKADNSIVHQFQASKTTCVHYEKPQEVQQVNQTVVLNKRVLQQKRNGSFVVESRIMSRKVRTQIERSPINKIFDIENYASRQYSPVKQQNKQVEESRVKIFESRMQNKYFKIEE